MTNVDMVIIQVVGSNLTLTDYYSLEEDAPSSDISLGGT